jgi:beta-lysine 5,6-aminomutase alpha subunit
MSLRIDVDPAQVSRARQAAGRITQEIQSIIDRHTTVTIERTVARFFGIDGTDAEGVPYANIVVDNIRRAGQLGRGAALLIGRAIAYHDLDAQEVAEAVARGAVDLGRVPARFEDEGREIAAKLASQATAAVAARRRERAGLLRRYPSNPPPLLYVIVATGNIYEDVVQAQAAARQGADIIAVIRTTGQSLLDYVPYGVVGGGFGGTYATQEHFRIMRRALDEVSAEVGRYIRLVNYASGLCMPEIAALGAMERLDMMLNDAMYGVLFRDINMRRTFVDQFMSRVINAYAGLVINTGEDNYMTTSDPVQHGHTVLASQFINESFALRAGLRPWQIGLGHVFAMDPALPDGMLNDLAQAALTRAVFPECTLKYMPQTRYKTGNIFTSYAVDVLHNLTSVATGQTITLLGMLTEAIHTPYMQDRFLAIQNARYVSSTARHLGDELTVRPGGRIETRAREVLGGAVAMLEQVDKAGLMGALEQGLFAGIRRGRDAGKGGDGVAERRADYHNPVLDLMLAANQAGESAPGHAGERLGAGGGEPA